MAANAYIGINGVARKIKAIDVGVENIAREVTKGYIGVDGVARLFYTSAPPKAGLTHRTTALSIAGYRTAGTIIDAYAFFFNGAQILDAYDEDLTRRTVTPSIAMSGATASTGNYALFADRNNSAVVNCIDDELTTTTINPLPYAWSGLIGLTYNSHALFTGGWRSVYSGGVLSGYAHNSDLYSYNSDLTMTTYDGCGHGTIDGMAADTGTLAIFAGGYYRVYRGTSNMDGSVVAINSSFTKFTATSMAVPRQGGIGVKAGSNAIFPGGYSTVVSPYTKSPVVEAYDSSLVQTVIEPLEVDRIPVGASTGKYAVLSGGGSNVVEVYGSSLTKLTYEEELSGTGSPTATNLGSSAFFGGGYNTAAVDVFTEE